jgi:hypothetical protein
VVGVSAGRWYVVAGGVVVVVEAVLAFELGEDTNVIRVEWG